MKKYALYNTFLSMCMLPACVTGGNDRDVSTNDSTTIDSVVVVVDTIKVKDSTIIVDEESEYQDVYIEDYQYEAGIDQPNIPNPTWTINPEGRTIVTRYSTPEGFVRMEADEWGEFLRNFPLKPADHIAVNCDGAPVHSAEKPYSAVFDIDLIGEDLQQCADAMMRLRCEFYYRKASKENKFDYQKKIGFHFVNGFPFDWWRFQNPAYSYDKKFTHWHCSDVDAKSSYNKIGDVGNENFRKYLLQLFSHANTWSVQTFDSYAIKWHEVRVGDILVKGGFPGHLVTVVDAATDKDGHIALILAQSYMPAQEIEVVKDKDLLEWYIIDDSTPFIYAGWEFHLNDFRRLKDGEFPYNKKLK